MYKYGLFPWIIEKRSIKLCYIRYHFNRLLLLWFILNYLYFSLHHLFRYPIPHQFPRYQGFIWLSFIRQSVRALLATNTLLGEWGVVVSGTS